MVATIRAQVMLSLFTDFKDFTQFAPDRRHEDELKSPFDQLIAWAVALETVRSVA